MRDLLVMHARVLYIATKWQTSKNRLSVSNFGLNWEKCYRNFKNVGISVAE